MNGKPLIAHVIYRLDTGGMEQIAVSVINGTRDRYQHAVICLAGFGAMRGLIEDATVACLSLDKQPGKDWGCYFRLWKALRRLQPDLVQTYNIGTLDAALIARLAGVRRVVHAEHGRDAADPRGESRKYRLLRRWLQPSISRFVAVSGDLQGWLRDSVGIHPPKIVCITNGIDVTRYSAVNASRGERPLLGTFAPSGTVLIVTVGRLDAVKDHASLIASFRMLCDADSDMGARLRLVIVGEGAQRRTLETQIVRLELGDRIRLLGNRSDVPALLSECDVFALSSLAEGMPLTVLEAMAAALPVVATDVGSVCDMVVNGATGTLVAPADITAMAGAISRYAGNPDLRQRHGRAGSARVAAYFGLAAMVSAYAAMYDELLVARGSPHRSSPRAEWAGRGEH